MSSLLKRTRGDHVLVDAIVPRSEPHNCQKVSTTKVAFKFPTSHLDIEFTRSVCEKITNQISGIGTRVWHQLCSDGRTFEACFHRLGPVQNARETRRNYPQVSTKTPDGTQKFSWNICALKVRVPDGQIRSISGERRKLREFPNVFDVISIRCNALSRSKCQRSLLHFSSLFAPFSVRVCERTFLRQIKQLLKCACYSHN
jgi:hypothetical protein